MTSTERDTPVPTARGRWRANYDVELMRCDVAAKGWTQLDLARRVRVRHEVINRFLTGRNHNPKTAAKIARALGRPLERYSRGVELRRPE